MGGIELGEVSPIIESHRESVAALYDVEDTPDVRKAGRGLIDSMRDGHLDEPLLVLVAQADARVFVVPLATLGLQRKQEGEGT